MNRPPSSVFDHRAAAAQKRAAEESAASEATATVVAAEAVSAALSGGDSGEAVLARVVFALLLRESRRIARRLNALDAETDSTAK